MSRLLSAIVRRRRMEVLRTGRGTPSACRCRISERTCLVRIDGRSLGNGTAFSAVAPSQRPVCDAHQSKIFESGTPIESPRARIPGRLTSSRLVGSARTVVFY
jgi:hypothetical protein